jgi:phosphoglycolate phosphatase
MMPQFPVYLFDVDGTLVDSAQDICTSIQQVLAARGRDGFSFDFLRRYIGRQLLDVFTDTGFEPELIDALIAEYRDIYLARCHQSTRVFPGIHEMMASLGGRKSTATTKGSNSARTVLEQFGLLPHFDHVQGTDGFPAKPEPGVILKALSVLNAKPEDCLLIGDSAADMEAGRRAGVKLCAVRWGYGDLTEMAKWNPEYWIDHPHDLLS